MQCKKTCPFCGGQCRLLMEHVLFDQDGRHECSQHKDHKWTNQ